jgi:predicted ATP-binding protein involved in virulence
MRFELKLKEIHLQNFRLFEDINVQFDDKLTVLIGENGAGKTALLKGIVKSLNVFTEKMKTALTNVDFKTIYKDSDIQYDKKQSITTLHVDFLEIEKLLPESGSIEDFQKKLEQSTSETDIQKIIEGIDTQLEALNTMLRQTTNDEDSEKLHEKMQELSLFKDKTEEKEFLQQNEDKTSENSPKWESLEWEIRQTKTNAQISKFSELKELDRLANQVHEADRRDESLSLPVVVYYSSERLAVHEKNQLGEEDTSVFNTYDDALNGKSLNFKWFLNWFIWKEDNRSTEQTLLDTIQSAIFTILNDDENVFKSLKTNRTRRNDYRLIMEKGKAKIEINQLSSGEKSLFVLVSDLARRLSLANPQSENPLKDGQGIVLIDEIDLHLHPRWQRKVLTCLQEIFPKIQWVVTTHSPLVISGYDISPQQVLILTEEEDTNHKMVISLADLHVHNSGVEPNRILEEIMRVRLRDKMAEDKMADLSKLLNPVDFEKPSTRQLMDELTKRFGTDDSFIKRAEHTFKILNRKKAVL